MPLDTYRAVRHAYPGDDIVRYADGRVTRNGVDMTPAEITAVETAYQPVHDALVAARAAAQAEAAQRKTEADAIKIDPQVRRIINASPAQIETFIDNNVNNLADAKSFLKKLTKAVSAIGREAFIEN